MKKLLLIIGILAVVATALFLIFNSTSQTTESENDNFSIKEFWPFGKTEDFKETDGTEKNNQEQEKARVVAPPASIPRLRKISSEPVAGAVIFNSGTTTVIRFVEKGTGNVYEANSLNAPVQRLTNTTIPKIIRAFWLPNGSGFLAQTLATESEIIETSFVKLNKNISTSNESLTPFATSISKLPTGIKEITVNTEGDRIFYYTVSEGYGASNWFVSKTDGTGAVSLMSHPLTEWIPKWISKDLIAIQNKSDSGSVGYSYVLNLKNKTLVKTGLGLLGISSNPNSDASFILTSSGGGAPQLALFDAKKTSLKTIGASTLAEKCVWLKGKNPTVYCATPNQIPEGLYPEAWYMGTVSTEDFIEKMDLNNDLFYRVADLSSLSSEKIDVSDLNMSPDETHLIFRNKIDGYLWMLRVGK